MNHLITFGYIETRKSPISLAVKHDCFKSSEESKASRHGWYFPHHAEKLKIKPKFVEAVTMQPGDHISICRYRVFMRDGRKYIAWAGTQTYPYTGRYARMLINAYHPGAGTRRPYLTIDGNF